MKREATQIFKNAMIVKIMKLNSHSCYVNLVFYHCERSLVS